jgi:hypothetical protein
LDQQHSIVQWALSACRWFLTGLYHNHRKGIEKVIQRVAGMAAVTACTVWLYLRHGRTPLEIISPRLDRLLTDYLALPWRHRCRDCFSRAHFRCERCGALLCGAHWRPGGLAGACTACVQQAAAAASGPHR